MGCPILDGMMGGGIQCGLITELVGARDQIALITFHHQWCKVSEL